MIRSLVSSLASVLAVHLIVAVVPCVAQVSLEDLFGPEAEEEAQQGTEGQQDATPHPVSPAPGSSPTASPSAGPLSASPLAGTWRHEKIYFSGGFSANTILYLTLRPDGTFSRGSRLMAGMEHADETGSWTGSTSADTGDGGGETGRWSVSGDTMTLVHGDGSESRYTYTVEGSDGQRSMLLKPDEGKNELWHEVQ